MTDISVNSLVKSFEIGTNVLDGLSFSINYGEHVGILGHNGCGKTTLFRILTGEIDYDEGEVSIAPSKRIGLISQIPVYPPDWTTEDVLCEAQRRLIRLQQRMEDLSVQMESDDSRALLAEYDRLQDDFRRLGGYSMEIDRNRVANGLDIPESMRSRLFSSLSGGEKTRVNLARLILEDTDILMLDEPTNHLDLKAVEWLEDYILHFKGTVLTISHDRFFLDRIVHRIIDISSGRAEYYSGNYSFYVEERQRRFEEKLKQYEKDQAKIEQLTRAAEQMHLWAFMGMDKLHKRAFSMEKRIEKLSHSEKPTEQKKLSVKFKQREFNGDEVLVTDSLSKGYEGRTLFSNLELLVTGGERIALIGDNGVGKSTLVKLIMGEEAPDSGYLYRGPQVRTAYLPQIVEFPVSDRNMVDTMLYEARCTPQEARDRLASFGFRGESVMTPVGALSGGERSRLKLCMLMGGEINLLILDEPTNHLDIASREWIEDALSGYTETLLFVSHDRYFIEKFATRVWALSPEGITDFHGSYAEYRAWRERQDLLALQAAKTVPKEDKSTKKKADNSDAADTGKPVRKPNNSRALQKLEKEIAKNEKKLEELQELADANASDYVKLMEIEDEKNTLEELLLGLYEQWEELSQ